MDSSALGHDLYGIAVDEQRGAADDDVLAGGEAFDYGDRVADDVAELDSPDSGDIDAVLLLHDQNGILPGADGRTNDRAQGHRELPIG